MILAGLSVAQGGVMPSRDRVRHKTAKEERVTGLVNSKSKAGKRSFKTESWYAAAAPKMSAARTATKLVLGEVPVAPLAPD